MSHLNLLFTSATQGLLTATGKSRQTKSESYTDADEAESACPGSGGLSDNYRLPSGIDSLEHWLDLNA